MKIQLPFDFIDTSRQSTSRKSVDDYLNRYSNVNNSQNRRASLVQKDRFANLLKVNRVNWEKQMEGSMIIRRPKSKK